MMEHLKYVNNLTELQPALSSADALKYSKPNSIEYEDWVRYIPLGFDIKYYGNHSFINIRDNLSGCYPILPAQNEEKQGKKLILLDLDGTLIDYNTERAYLRELFEFMSIRFEIGIHSSGQDLEYLIDKWNRKYCNGNIM